MEVLTVKDTAQFLKLSQWQIYRLVKAKKIPFVKIGGTIRFNKSDIANWISTNTVTNGK